MNYRNITISGLICVGSSTLASQLEEKLGWKYWNAGQFFRDYCKAHNLKLENTADRSDELSRKVDYGMRKDLKENSGLIFEGWLSGFVAQSVKGVLKILLYCGDGLRIDRFVNRENMGVEESKKHIFKREHENRKKWSRVYEGQIELMVSQKEFIEKGKDLGLLVGLGVDWETKPEKLDWAAVENADQVLVMGYRIGAEGQKLNLGCLEKVKVLRKRGFEKEVCIDGGVNEENIQKCVKAGADVLAVGSALYKAENIKEKYEEFLRLARGHSSFDYW